MAIQSPAGEGDSGRPRDHAGQTVDGDVVEGTGMSDMSVRLVYGGAERCRQLYQGGSPGSSLMLNVGKRSQPPELWVPLVPMWSSDVQRQHSE